MEVKVLSSLYSIEKNEKNDTVKTLINRCNYCKQEIPLISDDRNAAWNNSTIISEILDGDQQFSENATIDGNKNVRDDQYVMSQTKARILHIHADNKADNVKSIVEHDDDDGLKSGVIIGDSK